MARKPGQCHRRFVPTIGRATAASSRPSAGLAVLLAGAVASVAWWFGSGGGGKDAAADVAKLIADVPEPPVELTRFGGGDGNGCGIQYAPQFISPAETSHLLQLISRAGGWVSLQ